MTSKAYKVGLGPDHYIIVHYDAQGLEWSRHEATEDELTCPECFTDVIEVVGTGKSIAMTSAGEWEISSTS